MFEARLANSIDALLWEKWDPIGVRGFGDDARDEYWSYVTGIERLVAENTSVNTIAQYLYSIETTTMELFVDRQRCQRVAAALVELAPDTLSA
jgi:hypothetical protein